MITNYDHQMIKIESISKIEKLVNTNESYYNLSLNVNIKYYLDSIKYIN